MRFNLNTLSLNQTYALTFIVSLCLSALYWIDTPLINPDGLLYIEMAQALNKQGFELFFANYWHRWPFFSILVEIMHQWLPFSHETVCFLINAFALACTLLCFMQLSRKIVPIHSKQLWFVAFLFLLFPGFSDARTLILREPWGWCFLSLSMLSLTYYCEDKKISFLLLWCLSLIVSSLFRIEYSAYLILVPVLLVGLTCLTQKNYSLKKQIPLVFLLCLLSLLAWTALNQSQDTLSRSRELLQAPHDFWASLVRHRKITQATYPNFVQHFSSLFVLGGFLMIYAYKFLVRLTVPILFSLYLVRNQKITANYFSNNSIRFVWLSYFITALLIPAFVLIKTTLLPTRFLTIPCLLTLIPFLGHYQNFILKKNDSLCWKKLACLNLLFICSTITVPSKKIRALCEANHWLKENNITCLASNNRQFAYYLGFFTTDPKLFYFSNTLNDRINRFEGKNTFKAFRQQIGCNNTAIVVHIGKHKARPKLQKYFQAKNSREFRHSRGSYAIFIL